MGSVAAARERRRVKRRQANHPASHATLSYLAAPPYFRGACFTVKHRQITATCESTRLFAGTLLGEGRQLVGRSVCRVDHAGLVLDTASQCPPSLLGAVAEKRDDPPLEPHLQNPGSAAAQPGRSNSSERRSAQGTRWRLPASSGTGREADGRRAVSRRPGSYEVSRQEHTAFMTVKSKYAQRKGEPR